MTDPFLQCTLVIAGDPQQVQPLYNLIPLDNLVGGIWPSAFAQLPD